MDSSLIVLPECWINRSRTFGQLVVSDYAAGRNANSRAFTCFDAHSNVELQSLAKMAECAFALWAHLDPEEVVHWGRYCDDGADLKWDGRRWDVKATKMSGRFLIWPIAKNHIYESKPFDFLVLVKHDLPRFKIVGCVPKETFFNCKQVAGDEHPLFRGTWHMHENNLAPMNFYTDAA